MKAIAITRSAPDNIAFLQDIELPQPQATGHDLLIEVKAISVNPVDTKVRAGFTGDTPRVLGWDAVGVVAAVGEAVGDAGGVCVIGEPLARQQREAGGREARRRPRLRRGFESTVAS